jgi:hypothetical protein
VETAEALAEYFHQQLRREWGIGGADSPHVQKLFKGHYRGCRYSFGYPACPSLEDQGPLFKLIDPTRVGITLSEQFPARAGAEHHGHRGPPPGREVLRDDPHRGLCDGVRRREEFTTKAQRTQAAELCSTHRSGLLCALCAFVV